MVVYYDTRERTPFTETEAWKDVEAVCITMHTADYTNDDGLLIERKSIPDICNSLGRGKERFMREVERGFQYLIIEGTEKDVAAHLKRRHSRMSAKYIMSMLNRIHNQYGVDVIMCKDREEAASIALYLLQGGEL